MKTFNTAIEARYYSRNNPLETVESKSYWSNGQLSYHRFYVNGKPHGEYKSYHDSGQRRTHRFYVNGNIHGEYKWYHDNGQLDEHRFYVNGEAHGEFKSYTNDGQLSTHRFYVNGEVFDVDHLIDGSYKSLCIKHTLFNGNIIDEDI